MFAVNSMTLRARTEAAMEKTYVETVTTSDGATIEVTAIEHIPEERAIHYIASGNYKLWVIRLGAIEPSTDHVMVISASLEVDTRDWRKPTLIIEAIINGKSAYRYEFIGQPVSLSFTSSLTINLGSALKGIFNKIGLGRTLL